MSRQARHDWIFSRTRTKATRTKRSAGRAASQRRLLRLEPLEDRCLLAITVDTLADQNDGIGVGGISLRDALAAATPGETIDFAVTGTILLEHGELLVNRSLTIAGPGARELSIDAGGASRVFNVDNGVAGLVNVAISDLTITRGVTGGDGGGILNRENLTVARTAITDNQADDGGGIANFSGTLSVVDSTISGNSAANWGGGVFNFSALAQTSTLKNSTISGNSAVRGGGINNFSGTLTIEFSTITANDAPVDEGSGVSTWADTNTTLTRVRSSIIAGNANTDVDVFPGTFPPTFFSLGYNLIGDGDGAQFFLAAGDQRFVANPLLGPLADNGGPTQTHALVSGSPAIDAGNPAAVPGVNGVPQFDQRGTPFARTFDGDDNTSVVIDIGAFETDQRLFVVNTIDDNDDGNFTVGNFSLREAIGAANEVTVGTAHIIFAQELTSEGANTISLSLGQLEITNRMIIEGPGADRLTINAQGNSRVFDVDDEVIAVKQTVELSGLTLTGGFDTGSGGAIISQERLTVRDSVITGNSAQWGGGIYNTEFGELTVLRSQLTNNHAIEPLPGAVGSGGALYNWGGTVHISDSTISGNDSVSHGGGILNANHGTLAITRSTVSDNNATANGGGLANNDGNIDIVNSTFSGNEASSYGGGLFINTPNQYTTTITSSTISGNIAPLGGAGIRADNGLTVIEFSTITENNSNDFAGSGVRASAPVQVRSSIIAGNHHTDAASAGPFDFESNGYNLIGEFGLGNVFNQEVDEIIGNADPLLGPLADNGGPTWTHALLPGSPAIDAGDPNAVAGSDGVPKFDQRGVGFDRVRDGNAAEGIAIDKGAFEVQEFIAGPALPGDYNLDETVDAADYTLWRDTLGASVTQFSGADGDGDGQIDQDDYQVWVDNFGESLPGSGGTLPSAALAGAASIDGLIVVTTLEDETNTSNGLTSLREAIFAANIVGGPNTIQFAESLYAAGPATILLTLGELLITDEVSIEGPGADRLTIDASGNDLTAEVFGDGSRIFNIDDGVNSVARAVEIRGLTLTGGDANQHGGAILSREKLLAEHLVITDNWATLGGAIALLTFGAESVIADNTISHNTAATQGGALFVQLSSGNATIRNNTISHNEGNRGGAIYAGPGDPARTLVITSNTISENTARQQGGAIYVAPQAPLVTIRDSQISGNTSVQQGGGVFALAARNVSIVNCQIIENRSTSENQTMGRGGGVYASSSDLVITGSTISGNTAISGGGVYSRIGELAINFSTVSDNRANNGRGGGILSSNDRFSLIGSTVSRNVVTGEGAGGGVWHAPSFTGLSNISDSTLSGNTAALSGGGLYFRPTQETATSAQLSLTNLVVTGNTAGSGGGIGAGSGSVGIVAGTLNIMGGEISNNFASSGGGVYARVANLTVNGTTISGNRAGNNGGGIAGPANTNPGAQLNLLGATFVDNEAGVGSSLGGPRGDGGGVWIGPGISLTSINHTRFVGNSAIQGGAIFRNNFAAQSSLLVADSVITGNSATNRGGGLYNQGGVVSVMRSQFNGNTITNDGGTGGGIHNRQADLAISTSSIDNNSALLARAGGIYHSNGDLTVSNTTIAGNSALRDAGVSATTSPGSDRISFHSSTISSNFATQGVAGLSLQGDLTIRYTTITANRSAVSAIAAGLSLGGSLFEVEHSIIAGNTIGSGAHVDLFASGISNANFRFSLIGNGTNRGLNLTEAPLGSPDAYGNFIGRTVEMGGQGLIDPLFGPLANNGGPTRTHALLPGSPALDAGALISGPPLGYDQRGNPFQRMVDGTGDGVVRIDMGAYESQGVPSFTVGDFNRDGLVDVCDFVIFRDQLGRQVEPFSQSDADGNGIVDYDDYEFWKANFGKGLTFTTGLGGSASFALADEPTVELPKTAGGPLATSPPISATSPTSARSRVASSRTASVSPSRLRDDALLAYLAKHACLSADGNANTDAVRDGETDDERADFDLALDDAFSTF